MDIACQERPLPGIPKSENLYVEETLTGKLPVALTDGSNEGETFPPELPSRLPADTGEPDSGRDSFA